MLKRRLCVSAALCALFWTAAPGLAYPVGLAQEQEGELQERELKKLAEALEEALETFDGGPAKKRAKAREELDAELISIGKRRKVPAGTEIQESLSLTADLGRALYLTNKFRALARGRIQSFEVPNTEISYAVHAPSKYDPKKHSYPVCVIIPGLDDGKVLDAKTLLQEYWTDGALRDEVILVAVNMPEETESWTEHETSDGQAGGIKTVMRSLAAVRNTFACDFDRFFLAGRGIGVPAAMHLGNLFPHLFAGVIGRAGDAGDTGADNFRNLPTYFAGSGAQASAFEEQIKAAGYGNCTLATSVADADVLTWIKAHPRDATPAKVTLVPGSPIPNTAYWIQVPPTDAGGLARIEAEADRENNTITITGQGVASVIILFNDQLVDMSQSITVILNGVSQESVIPRNLDTVLEYMFRGKSDPGRIYTAVKSYDLPEPVREDSGG